MSDTEVFNGLLVTEVDRGRIKKALEWLAHEDQYHSVCPLAYPAWYPQAIKDCQIIVNRALAKIIMEGK